MGKSFKFYFYILKCADDSYYTGVTNDIDFRLKQHNEGIDKKSYTFSRRPLELVFANDFKYIDKAIAFEKQIKGWSRKKKEAIIEGDWNKLKELAACKNASSHLNYDKE